MVDYRDQRSDRRMHEEDWRTIEEGLVRPLALLKHAVARGILARD